MLNKARSSSMVSNNRSDHLVYPSTRSFSLITNSYFGRTITILLFVLSVVATPIVWYYAGFLIASPIFAVAICMTLLHLVMWHGGRWIKGANYLERILPMERIYAEMTEAERKENAEFLDIFYEAWRGGRSCYDDPFNKQDYFDAKELFKTYQGDKNGTSKVKQALARRKEQLEIIKELPEMPR